METDNAVNLLASLLRTLPKSIEIIPGDGSGWIDPSHSAYPFLLQEGNLGVPQKMLYKQYMIAIRLYQKAKGSRQPADTLVDLTGIILLANPAHQTALNTRKRLIMEGLLNTSWELDFSASLLSCRECTKESILWHHRRWLLHCMNEDAIEDQASLEISYFPLAPDIVNKEYSLIAHGCELYPRNYHAWTHRYFCTRSLILHINSTSAGLESSSIQPVAEEYKFMLRWIERHVSDYSAMQYVCRIEQAIQDFAPRLFTSSIIPRLKNHALSLMDLYSDHESVWMYLRGSSMKDPPSSADLSVFVNENPMISCFLQRHLAWVANQLGYSEFSASLAREVIGSRASGDTAVNHR